MTSEAGSALCRLLADPPAALPQSVCGSVIVRTGLEGDRSQRCWEAEEGEGEEEEGSPTASSSIAHTPGSGGPAGEPATGEGVPGDGHRGEGRR